jgi:hypothetical protein
MTADDKRLHDLSPRHVVESVWPEFAHKLRTKSASDIAGKLDEVLKSPWSKGYYKRSFQNWITSNDELAWINS